MAGRTSARRTTASRPTSSSRRTIIPLARRGWRPRVRVYLYVSLTAGTAFSPTYTMPLSLTAKLMHGVQSVVSLLIVALVTARAVYVLGN